MQPLAPFKPCRPSLRCRSVVLSIFSRDRTPPQVLKLEAVGGGGGAGGGGGKESSAPGADGGRAGASTGGGGSNLSMNQTLEGHEGSVVSLIHTACT